LEVKRTLATRHGRVDPKRLIHLRHWLDRNPAVRRLLRYRAVLSLDWKGQWANVQALFY